MPMDLRLQSQMTRYIDRERGYIVQIAEPNTDKHEILDHDDDANLLEVTSYMAFLPTTDKNGKPATFLCWYSVFPSGSFWPRWVREIIKKKKILFRACRYFYFSFKTTFLFFIRL